MSPYPHGMDLLKASHVYDRLRGTRPGVPVFKAPPLAFISTPEVKRRRSSGSVELRVSALGKSELVMRSTVPPYPRRTPNPIALPLLYCDDSSSPIPTYMTSGLLALCTSKLSNDHACCSNRPRTTLPIPAASPLPSTHHLRPTFG